MPQNQLVSLNLINSWRFAQIPSGSYSLAENATSITLTTVALQGVLANAASTQYGGSGAVIALQEAVLTQGSEAEGIATSSANNIVRIFTPAGGRLKDADGDEVYGRITKDGTNWVVTLYGTDAGAQVAYTNGNAVVAGLTLLLPVFAHASKMGAAAEALADHFVESNLNMSGGGALYQEVLTIATDNTLPALTKGTPTNFVNLIITHLVFSSVDTDPVLSYSGKTLTFNAANYPGTLKAGTLVVAQYS